jgi:hypothetical protein
MTRCTAETRKKEVKEGHITPLPIDLELEMLDTRNEK